MKISTTQLRSKIRPDSSISLVPELVDSAPSRHATESQAMMPPTAIALSMIVEITSLMPRVVLSRPANPLQSAPTIIATTTMKITWRKPGSTIAPPAAAAMNPASWY